jgi:RNA polymerase sigma-70 factor (ECF subfamily)
MSSSAHSSAARSGGGQFHTTHWSLVVAAGDPGAPRAREALASLCGVYWYPIYVFVRRQGFDADAAQDLTQEFFTRLLEKEFLAQVRRDKGKFRAFLLAACRHFLANQRDRARARKRGGGRTPVPLDFQGAEGRYGLEPAHDLTAEKLFERRWALTLLDHVLGRLREELVAAGKRDLFEALKTFLTDKGDAPRQVDVAKQLGMTAGAIKVAVHRLRRRYRELLVEEIARTLEDQEQVSEEISDLFAALDS